jgi:short-subunit dehydrogenase
MLDVICATLPVFKKQKSGHYVNISSFLGTWSIPPYSIYAATKFDVEGFSKSMAVELAGFGIKTTIVEPSVYATGFFGHALQQIERKPEYASVYEAYNQGVSSMKIGDPAKGVKAIIEMIKSENPPIHFPIGTYASHSILVFVTHLLKELKKLQHGKSYRWIRIKTAGLKNQVFW